MSLKELESLEFELDEIKERKISKLATINSQLSIGNIEENYFNLIDDRLAERKKHIKKGKSISEAHKSLDPLTTEQRKVIELYDELQARRENVFPSTIQEIALYYFIKSKAQGGPSGSYRQYYKEISEVTKKPLKKLEEYHRKYHTLLYSKKGYLKKHFGSSNATKAALRIVMRIQAYIEKFDHTSGQEEHKVLDDIVSKLQVLADD
jgi:hypothetical protein